MRTPGHSNDYSVCTTWGILGARFYLLHVFREQLNYPDLRRAVVKLKEDFQATMVVVEYAGSGISIYQDLNNTDDPDERWIHKYTPRGDKVSRLTQQLAKIEEGMVCLPTNAPWLAALKSELAVFPHGRHDDQVDSMSQFLRVLDHNPWPLESLSYYAG
ncbi:MAG: phage terminase large subunit [Alphaproteobacteria bacterium]